MKRIEAERVTIMGVVGVFRQCKRCREYRRISAFSGHPNGVCTHCYRVQKIGEDVGRSARTRNYRLTPLGEQTADDLLRQERAERRG